jgi:hypothetical protein
MSIKNFFVKVKPIRYGENGMLNMLRYLVDKKRHPNGIVNFSRLSDWETFFKRTYRNVNEHNMLKKMNGIRGRNVKGWGDSFVFSFPKGLEISNEKMKKIVNELITMLYNQFRSQLKEEGKKSEINCDIDLEDFTNNIFLNVHTNEHIHINVIFGKIIPIKDLENGTKFYYSNRISNRKRFLNVSKGIFNKIILDNFELDVKDYQPQTNFKKGYKSIYIKDKMEKLDKKITELKKTEEETDKKILELEDFLEMKRQQRKEEIEKIIKENEKRKEIVNNFHLLLRYYNRLITKTEKNELKGIRKDYNLIMEKIEKMENLTKNTQIRKMTKEIEEKTKQNYGKIYGVKM